MSTPPRRMLTIDEMFPNSIHDQIEAVMANFNAALGGTREERTTMASEQELLNVIAAAQRQLSALSLMPREEPVDQDNALFFAVTTQPGATAYTYALVRTANAAETACWFMTGYNVAGKAKRWIEVRDYFAGRSIQSWKRLYTLDAARAAVITPDDELEGDLTVRPVDLGEPDDLPKPRVRHYS